MAFIKVPQLTGRLEGSVWLVDRHGPGDALGAGDMSATLRSFLRVAGHMDQFAGVFLRRTHVHQRQVLLDLFKNFLTEGPDILVRLFCPIIGPWKGWLFSVCQAAFHGPLAAPSIHNPAVL